MAIVETYLRRRARALRAGQPEVYRYDELPEALRVQIVLILRSTSPAGLGACDQDGRPAFDLSALQRIQAVEEECGHVGRINERVASGERGEPLDGP